MGINTIHPTTTKEVLNLLDVGVIYHIYDSSWLRLIHMVPEKCGMIVVRKEKNELIPIIQISDEGST